MIGASIRQIADSIIHLYPLRAAQGKDFPLATYQTISVNPANVMYARATARKESFQINVIARTCDEADSLAWQLITAFDQYSGTVLGEEIAAIKHVAGPDDLHRDEADVYGKSFDIDVWIKY